jgi:heme-degrading monooxygenase HmoA
MLAMMLRVRRRVIVVGAGGAEKRAAQAKKRKKLDLRETGFEAIQRCHVAFLEISDRTNQRTVTTFYSVTLDAVGAGTANPKNRTESGSSGDFNDHYSLITIHFSPVS